MLINGLLLYIDPSTGSMLFAVIIGMVSALFFGFKAFIMKMKSRLGVNMKDIQDKNKLDYVIFSDHKRYWNVFEPICDEFEKRGIEVHYWTMSDDDPALSKPYKYVKCEFIGSGNKGFAKLNFMNAKICLSTTPGLDVYQWKKSKDCDYYIHIVHAPGLNRGGYKMFGMDYFDTILSASNHGLDYVRELERKRGLKPKEIITVGVTYLDEMKKRYEKTGRIKNDIPVVLIAPSWGDSSLLERFGHKILDAAIDTGYKVVVRPHPQTLTQNPKLLNELQSKYKDIEWNFDNDNFDILNRSDIMISDFSGVIFDYSLIFDKPVIHTKTDFDWSTYDGAVLDDKSWTDRTLAKFSEELNEENISNLKDIIDNMLNSDKYNAGRKEVKEEIWQNVGKASETTVEYLVNKINELN